MNTPLTPESLREAAKKHPARRLRNAWGEFVALWPWCWFITLTFTHDTHPERALKLFRVWCSKLSREIYGRRWYRHRPYGVSWIVAVEPQKSGRVHLHALMTGVGDTRRLTWMDNWQGLDSLAGYPRIQPVKSNDAVSRYVSKYVAKGGDIYFSKNLELTSRDLFESPSPLESET